MNCTLLMAAPVQVDAHRGFRPEPDQASDGRPRKEVRESKGWLEDFQSLPRIAINDWDGPEFACCLAESFSPRTNQMKAGS